MHPILQDLNHTITLSLRCPPRQADVLRTLHVVLTKGGVLAAIARRAGTSSPAIQSLPSTNGNEVRWHNVPTRWCTRSLPGVHRVVLRLRQQNHALIVHMHRKLQRSPPCTCSAATSQQSSMTMSTSE